MVLPPIYNVVAAADTAVLPDEAGPEVGDGVGVGVGVGAAASETVTGTVRLNVLVPLWDWTDFITRLPVPAAVGVKTVECLSDPMTAPRMDAVPDSTE